MRKGKKNFIIVAVVFLAIILLFVVKFKIDSTFSVKRWDTKIEKRFRMYDSLMKKYNLVGMTREEIIALLGTNGICPGTDITYSMGGEVWPIQLEIYFDEHGKVISVYRFMD